MRIWLCLGLGILFATLGAYFGFRFGLVIETATTNPADLSYYSGPPGMGVAEPGGILPMVISLAASLACGWIGFSLSASLSHDLDNDKDKEEN